ncbi:PAS domain-containing sensor histidine kinase [Endozoicomonas sp. OPT23]|uniref:nitrogen regulation protein NR(II) n=1 Tax=Endozoicomonas sp. OPT23 TaxID=2072845 RepID=UPI001D6F498F|nr:PAS domain-containing sensor histidine kinase [Endozoicomonas sp. OPT23]
MNANFLLDNLNTAIIALDEGFSLSYLNQAAEALLDISQKSSKGLPVSSIIEHSALQEDLHRARQQNQQFTRRESELMTHNGAILVDYTVTPSDISEASLIIEVHPRDRLQRITREESLVAKQTTSRILARGLAHEIKNPLGGILGSAQLLDRQLNEPDQKEYTYIIIEEAKRLRDLVDQMLGPIQPPKMLDLNIHEVLERVIQLTHAETEGELSIIKDYDPSIPNFPADRERLIQALLNLLRNAMQAIKQYMPLSDGEVRVTSRIARQFTIGNKRQRLVCHLTITDNGPGIPEHLKESIFYPMISGRPEGTGLGLPMAQYIISQHHGLIECDSKPGQTSFHVYLPLLTEEASQFNGAYQ